MLSFFKILKINEILFTFSSWVLIFVIYFSFSWFFDEPVTYRVYLVPIGFALAIYIGYLLNSYSSNEIPYEPVQKKNYALLFSLIGFVGVVILFLMNRDNVGKDIAEIRDQHRESYKAGFADSIFTSLFPLHIIAFIIANYNNLKYKFVINIITLLSCIAFIPINGGRVFILVFGCIYATIFLMKNFEKVRQRIFVFFLRVILIFILFSFLGAAFTILRIGAESTNIFNSISQYKFVNYSAAKNLTQIPNNVGIGLVMIIFSFYDYTGGCVFYLDIFLREMDKIETWTYGLYNFNYFDKFGLIDFMKVHDSIDKLYTNYDVQYNVWAGFVRDFYADFRLTGTFIFVVILSRLMFNAKKYLSQSYSAQVLYFMTFAAFLFSPFHSLFYITRTYGLAYVIALIIFLRNRKKYQLS